MSTVNVGLVQINNSFSGQNYLPYSVGVLQSYAQKKLKDPSQFKFMLPVYLRGDIEESYQKIANADLVFFSAYVWNINISLELAKTVKQRNPNTVVVFGGPHVPNQAEAFLRVSPFIDLVCHGEGEQTFTRILEAGIERARAKQWDDIEGVSYLKNGEFIYHPPGKRLENMEEIPSPFLSGAFDELIAANPNEKWIAVWETNRGCPFSCTYCDWGSATQSRVYKFEMERIYREIDWFADKKIEFIFCADANFGMLPRDYDIVKYTAEVKQTRGYPHALSVQNTKNGTERAYQVQKLLAEAGLNKGVTIALQSTDPTTLKQIKRSNISTESFQELQRRFTKDRIETYTDIILGLPGETYDTMVNGVAEVIENGQHNRIQFNNLSILPNAEMGDPEYQKKYGMILMESEVINIHGSLARTNNEILERQVLVVGTDSCPKEDWVKTRAFCWMAAFVYFDKLLQLPLLLTHSLTGVRFKEMLTLFTDSALTDYPVIAGVREFFNKFARDIQNGAAEYYPSEKWLNIWWPADELMFIQLATEGKMDAFYEEAGRLLQKFVKDKGLDMSPEVLSEALQLNRQLVKLPFQDKNLTIDLNYNLWDIYKGALVREKVALEKKKVRYEVDRTSKVWTDWQVWCREVVWWGNKKGAYLYSNLQETPQISGHF